MEKQWTGACGWGEDQRDQEPSGWDQIDLLQQWPAFTQQISDFVEEQQLHGDCEWNWVRRRFWAGR